jgi:hypothetical protein
MISRKTAMLIAGDYTRNFSRSSRGAYGHTNETVYSNALYDFLYENEYQAWFCNLSKGPHSIRSLREWFLKIHTGESLYSATQNWQWDKRLSLGQEYLLNLARDILKFYAENFQNQFYGKIYTSSYEELIRRLEIDGYSFKDGHLYQAEPDVLNVEEEISLLEKLHISLKLSSRDNTFGFFKLSEEHYISGKWSDCISNSRKFFEAILAQVAFRYASHKNIKLGTNALERPVEVRVFLENQGLLEKRERESVDKIYGLLSHTGSHPYMAEKDQARLLRQISLTFTQFVMLRLEGALV